MEIDLEIEIKIKLGIEIGIEIDIRIYIYIFFFLKSYGILIYYKVCLLLVTQMMTYHYHN